MNKNRNKSVSTEYDVIVIGAGFCGIIFLKYALEKNLNCLVLEKQSKVGGLWNRLPEWQDIQNRLEDFAINKVPLEGAQQADICEHAREWVDKYDLLPHIRLNNKVTSVSWNANHWKVNTENKQFTSKYLISATGVQNQVFIPKINRTRSKIIEKHSSSLQKPEVLNGKKVSIIGGGASSWDLLDLAIENNAKEIHWVYRSNPLWFLPTTRTKQESRPNLREFAVLQSTLNSTNKVNDALQKLLSKKYDYFNLKNIEPDRPFDVRKHQLIPGRSSMLQNLDEITRHKSEVIALHDQMVSLKTGEQFETEIILWGTGYRMDLQYLDLPEFNKIKTLDDLKPRLGSLVRSKDYPQLFFVGMSLIKSTSSTPLFAAIQSKSIVSHILGECDIPLKSSPHQVTHWDLFGYYAKFDKANYPWLWWRIKHFILAWWYKIFPNKTIKI